MNNLTIYENAKQALAEYKSIDEVKEFRDKAVAVEAYARQANDYDLEHDASIARVRAERKCGELLRNMEKNKGAATPSSSTIASPTLSEMGVTADQSSKWQKLANVPEQEFEDALSKPGIRVSSNQILNKKNGDKPERIDTQVLWLWGRLKDMEQDNLFDRPLAELIDEMTDGMKPDAYRIIPKLKRWINDYT